MFDCLIKQQLDAQVSVLLVPNQNGSVTCVLTKQQQARVGTAPTCVDAILTAMRQQTGIPLQKPLDNGEKPPIVTT